MSFHGRSVTAQKPLAVFNEKLDRTQTCVLNEQIKRLSIKQKELDLEIDEILKCLLEFSGSNGPLFAEMKAWADTSARELPAVAASVDGRRFRGIIRRLKGVVDRASALDQEVDNMLASHGVTVLESEILVVGAGRVLAKADWYHLVRRVSEGSLPKSRLETAPSATVVCTPPPAQVQEAPAVAPVAQTPAVRPQPQRRVEARQSSEPHSIPVQPSHPAPAIFQPGQPRLVTEPQMRRLQAAYEAYAQRTGRFPPDTGPKANVVMFQPDENVRLVRHGAVRTYMLGETAASDDESVETVVTPRPAVPIPAPQPVTTPPVDNHMDAEKLEKLFNHQILMARKHGNKPTPLPPVKPKPESGRWSFLPWASTAKPRKFYC